MDWRKVSRWLLGALVGLIAWLYVADRERIIEKFDQIDYRFMDILGRIVELEQHDEHGAGHPQ